MTDIEKKIILNAYDVFPVKYFDEMDINSAERNAYIKGGMDAVKLYECGLDEVMNVPIESINDIITEPENIIEDPSAHFTTIKGEMSNKLF